MPSISEPQTPSGTPATAQDVPRRRVQKDYPPAPAQLPPREIFPGVWFISASHPHGFPPGLRYSRNMVVVRTAEGLVLLNPVRLSDTAQRELLHHGPIKHVVRLGTYHGRDDAYYVETFDAEFWGVPGKQSYPSPAFTRELSEHGPFPIPGARALIFTQAALPECVVLLPAHRLLVTCDSVQHYLGDPQLSLLAHLIMRPMGFFKPCVIGPLWLKAATPAGQSLRADFARILATDFDNLVSAHGVPMFGGAKAALAEQVAQLR